MSKRRVEPPTPRACAVDSPWLLPDDGSFHLRRVRTRPPAGAPDETRCKTQLREQVDALDGLQQRLHAEGRRAVLILFQAMDAAGKDSTIRAVFSGVNPAGCAVHAFRQPTPEELGHDILWRSSQRLPAHGQIGVFNRSWYETVLIERVHPALAAEHHVPIGRQAQAFWAGRYQSIRDHELHLARNGTTIVKFWLHVSRDEQRRRLLARLDDPDKHWKFQAGDLAEREHWPAYQKAAAAMLGETTRPWAPWYVIPADDKPWMRATVADIIVRTMTALDLRYPVSDQEQLDRYAELRRQLVDE